MKFHIAHLSFVPSAQKTLIKSEFKCTPIELAEKLLRSNAKYIPRKGKRGVISLYFGDFLIGDDGRLLSARLGKSKDVILPKYDDTEQKYHDEKDKINPHVYFLWDRDEQEILLERDTGVFQNYEVVIKSIEDHLNNLMNNYEIRVFVEPLTEKMDFWKAIQSYKNHLYEVNFEMHMPNFLGKTVLAIKEALDMYKKDYNATGITNQISNEDGKLNLHEDDPKVNANLEWITKGGGKWYIKGKKGEGKRKARISSTKSQYIKTEETTIELENYTVKEIVAILAELKPKYTVFNKKI